MRSSKFVPKGLSANVQIPGEKSTDLNQLVQTDDPSLY